MDQSNQQTTLSSNNAQPFGVNQPSQKIGVVADPEISNIVDSPKNKTPKSKLKLVLLVLMSLLLVTITAGAILILTKSSNDNEPSPGIKTGNHLVEFQEVRIRNNASGDTAQTICYFTELPSPVKKVIRTRQEYNSYLAEAESKGYEAFALNRDNDKFGTYKKYQNIDTFQKYQEYCKGQYQFPEFDFSKSTLLGQFTPAGGCSVDFDKKVTRNEKDKKVDYTIDVNSSGGCEMAISSFNWILVPSIPDDYQVNFNVLVGGKVPPTPKPTPDLTSAAVPTGQAAVDVINDNRAVQIWKSYMDELTEPQPSLRIYQPSPDIVQDKWHVSIQGIKDKTGDWFVAAWIDPYSGKIEVLNFSGSLQRLSSEQQDAINQVNQLPDSY